MSHLSPGHETSVILYFVQHFSEVWKYERVWQSQDVVAFPPSLEPLTFFRYFHSVVSISWFYFCNWFYIFLNAIFTFRQQFCDWKILALFHCHLFEYPTRKQAHVFPVTKSPSVLYLRLFIYLFIFLTETSKTSYYLWFCMFEIFHLNEPYICFRNSHIIFKNVNATL